jgi:hypothetical protein
MEEPADAGDDEHEGESDPAFEPEPEPEPEPERGPAVSRPGSGSLDRVEARRNEFVRRWDVVSPSATRIGRPERPDGDVSERLRRLHEERHPAMAGHGARAHFLDKMRITQALCNRVGLTRWQRDRVLGVMRDLDLEAFGSQRAVPKVALVVIRHVVDVERRRHLGLEDTEWVQSLSPEAMEELYERFHSIAEDPDFELLCEQHGLDRTALNRLRRTLTDQLEAQGLEGAAYGRNRARDRALPEIPARHRVGGERP